MRTEYLRYLLEIDRHHSISAAAQSLYLSQNTLSASVHRIEEKLGFSVFIRAHNGVQTTAEGEEALTIVSEILDRFKEIEALGGHGTETAPVTLLLSPSVCEFLSVSLNKLFLARLPDGNLEFHTAQGDNIGSQIISSESNIGITYYSADHLAEYRSIASKYQVDVTVLGLDRLYLLVRRDHPLAGQERVSVGELNGLDFALLPHFNAQEDSIAYARHLGTGNRYTIFPSAVLLKRAVRRNNMVSILSGYTIQAGSDDHLKAIPLVGTKGKNEIALCLLHRNTQSLSDQENILIQCILERFQVS